MDAELGRASPAFTPKLAVFVAFEEVVGQMFRRETFGGIVPMTLSLRESEVHVYSPLGRRSMSRFAGSSRE